MLRILLTGSTGFVGRHFLLKCKASNVEVIPVVRSATKAMAQGIDDFLVFRELGGHQLRSERLESACLVHLVGASRDEPDNSLWQSIVTSTELAVLAAKEAGFRRTVYLSGYGVTNHSSEMYFRSKFEAEKILRSSEIPYTIFRCSYILGPGDELTPYLMEQLQKGHVEIPGDGSYRIQPLYISDVVSILLNAAMDESTKSYTLDVLGTPIPYAEFVRLLASKIAPEALISFVDLDTFIRRATFSLDPQFTTGELAVLMCDQVGPPSVSCLGVKLRAVEDFIGELIDSHVKKKTDKD